MDVFALKWTVGEIIGFPVARISDIIFSLETKLIPKSPNVVSIAAFNTEKLRILEDFARFFNRQVQDLRSEAGVIPGKASQ